MRTLGPHFGDPPWLVPVELTGGTSDEVMPHQ